MILLVIKICLILNKLLDENEKNVTNKPITLGEICIALIIFKNNVKAQNC